MANKNAFRIINFFCKAREQSGYTLIQMAIALLTIGIITVAALAVYNIYRVQNSILVTQEAVENAVTKIQTYRQVYGHYPCPAPMGVLRTDGSYGQSSNCLDTTQAVGSCSAGLCYQSFSRAIDHDNNPVTPDVVTAIRVRVGAIPFRNLQMDEKATFDGYDAQLTYAVTERMGDVTTFKELQGGIDIVDEQGQSLVEPAGSASFVVLSHGANKVGAFSAIAAGQVNPCAGAGLDVENCVDVVTPPAASRFLNTFESGGTTVFDDVVQYFAAASNPMWRRTALTSENITDMSDENVGLGAYSLANPPPSELSIEQTTVDSSTGLMKTPNSAGATHQSGALRVDDSPATAASPTQSVRADQYCNEDGTKCFQIRDFTGTYPGTGGFKCGSDYVTGIGSNGTNADPDCRPVAVACPLGQVLVGVNGDGSPNCTAVSATCAAASMTLCGQTINLIAAGNGNVQSFSYTAALAAPPVGNQACATIQYRCNNGTWAVNGGNYSNAYCTNALVSATNACPTGYNPGTYSSYTCGQNTIGTSCSCATTYTETQNCGAPFTGGTRSRTCTQACAPGPGGASCGSWTEACTCSTASYYELRNCQPGKVRKTSPTPANFGIYSPFNWPAGNIYRGEYRFWTIDTSTCNHSDGPWDDTNCECDNLPLYTKVLKSPSDYSLTPNHCYMPQAGNRTVMDGAAIAFSNLAYQFAVTKTPKDASCNLDTGATTTLQEATFIPRPYKWVRQAGAKTNSSVEATTLGYPEADDSCTCAQANNTSSCAVSTTGGYDFYTCKCTGS